MNKTVEIIGSQMDLGAVRKGVDMGPLAIRHAGLCKTIKELGYTVIDHGDVVLDVPENEGNPKMRYAKEVNAANAKLYEKVLGPAKNKNFPLIIGGDHSIAAGSISAVADVNGPIGVIWIDAHGDFNDENITPSGNMHGMPLSAVCGKGPDEMVAFTRARIAPQNVVLIGSRLLDPEEQIKLKNCGVTVFSISDVHSAGITEIMHSAIEIASKNTNGIHLSFDMDALDPSEAPGVGTPVSNGLTLREAFIACEFIHKSGKLLSMDLVETNPLLDVRNRTGILAVDIIATALGGTNY